MFAAPEIGRLHHISLDLGHVHAGISLALGLPNVSTLASICNLKHRWLATSWTTDWVLVCSDASMVLQGQGVKHTAAKLTRAPPDKVLVTHAQHQVSGSLTDIKSVNRGSLQSWPRH